MVDGEDFTNPFVGGIQLAFYYEGIRAISNGIVRLVFKTSIDEMVKAKVGGVFE